MSAADKERYGLFLRDTYAPIYSQPWWMDVVCGSDNWSVWLYEEGGSVVAAMPYYLEDRPLGRYITKAPLTQNNGIVFRHPAGAKPVARAKFEEKVIAAACVFIDSLDLAVYEQQYAPSFTNWLPFSWQGCQALPRYTFVIEDTSDLDAVRGGMTAKQRSIVKKGQRNTKHIEVLDAGRFYEEHEKVFRKQGLGCPFSLDLWLRLERSCRERGCGEALGALDEEGNVTSLLFVCWDERRMYHLLGGGIPPFQNEDTYAALTWAAISKAHELGLAYDFEGSMIKRIARSFREYGAEPQQYFRIRKVFDPKVVEFEAAQQSQSLAAQSKWGGGTV